MSNRRTFVAAAAGSTLLGSLMVLPAAAGTAAARRVGGSPTQATFQALEGEDFHVRTATGDRASLRLTAVRARASSRHTEQFSLVLRGDGAAPLHSGIYRVAHPVAGRLQLRLEPSGHDALGALYRADFNLLV